MNERWRSVAAVAALGTLAISGGACSPAESTSETFGGSGGSGGGASGHQTPRVDVAPFEALSVGLLHGESATHVSFSDVEGLAGCGLATGWNAAPPGVGHQVMIAIGAVSSGPCGAGTFSISPDCTPDNAESYGRTCAEYREWQSGKLAGASMAGSGTVAVTESDAYGGSCIVDAVLGFDESGTYDGHFQIVTEKDSPLSPSCQVAGP